MKTPSYPIIYWLNKLPEPYRTKALTNTAKNLFFVKEDSIWNALDEAFIWKESPQKFIYWEKLWSKLKHTNYDIVNKIGDNESRIEPNLYMVLNEKL